MQNYPDLKRLRILHYPHPALREQAKRIRDINRFLAEMSERMAEIMREAKGIGLAATQVGWPFRFVVMAASPEPGPDQEGARESARIETFINPVIIAREGKLAEEEGCLSVPGIFAKVRRAGKVRVRAIRLIGGAKGEPVELEAEGLAARAWQHELDHLEGTLFVDRLGPAGKILVAGSLRGMERLFAQAKAASPSDQEP